MEAAEFPDYEENHPVNEEMCGGRGLGALCAGTVALCSLYYVRLMKERRRREHQRGRRISRFRRSKARERLRFAVLGTSQLLSVREASAAAPVTEPQGGGSRCAALWSAALEKAFTGLDWTERFRMTKSTFGYLCDQLRPLAEKTDAIPAEVQVAMTLWRLGSSSGYPTIGKTFGVSRSTVGKVVRGVCEAVASILTPKFISVPGGDLLCDAMRGFKQRFGLSQLAGVIGAVPIRPPQGHSALLQAVVDSERCFWDLHIGSPGVLSDTQVLLTSELYESGAGGSLFPNSRLCMDGVEIPIHVLGAPCYPLLPWLMTPSSQDSSPELNKRFSSALRLAQDAFGRLKGRWRCLLKGGSDSDPSFLPTLIGACCTLHNICESRGDPFQESWVEDASEEDLGRPSERDEEHMEPEAASREIRDALARRLRAQNA